MKFETLYAIDKAGKIRIFECEIEENTYIGGFVIMTKTGLLDGKATSKDTKITKGKQKRSIKEQAEFEAKALWKAKRYEGYKTHTELCSKAAEILKVPSSALNYTKGQLFIQNAYKTIGINYNTNPDWHPLCMLAEKWKNYKDKVEYPVIVQPKLDGVRCIAFKERSTGKVRLMSRGGEYYIVPHIATILEGFFNEHPNYILDGEIYIHGVPQQLISGMVRTEIEAGLFTDSKQAKLEYHIYDVIPTDDMNYHRPTKQKERVTLTLLVSKYFFTNDELNKIKLVESLNADNEEDVNRLHDIYVAEGYEGIMVRDPEADYLWSFRDKRLLKVKAFEDAEFEIINYEMDFYDTTGETFVFILQNDINDKTFKARPTGSNEMKLHWQANYKNYIGKKATVKFKGRSQDGIPVHGSVRHKDTACLVTNIRKEYE